MTNPLVLKKNEKKMVFSYNSNEIYFFVWLYACEKAITKKKGTTSFVIMFGYGKGPAHCNAHTWVGLRVGLTFFRELA
jgi:hypothetical protein